MLSVFKNNISTEKGIGKYSCLLCRVKKKKCDRKLPSCSRCIQYKVKCEPYERNVSCTKIPCSIMKSDRNNNITIALSSEEKAKYSYFNSMMSNIALSPYNRLINCSIANLDFKGYSSMISAVSKCINIVVILTNDEDNINLAISNTDPTLFPSFWGSLLDLYITELYIFYPVFSINNLSFGDGYWIRTNIIYCYAYEHSTFRSPIATAKVNNLLLLSEYYLSLSPPNLYSIQCYILLYDFYRDKGNARKKELCFHNAIKISHLIGLTNKCQGISEQCEYERYLCYARLIEMYWLDIDYSNNNGLLLEQAIFWPKFSLNCQIINSIYPAEQNIVIANNVSLNVRFKYEVYSFIIPSLFKLIENGNIDFKSIAQIELDLDEIYKTILKELLYGPLSSDIFSMIKFFYLTIKLHLNSVLLKQADDAVLQAKYIELNFDLVRIYLNSHSKSCSYPITILIFLKTNMELLKNFNSANGGKLKDLVVIKSNLLKSSAYYKIL